MCENCNENKIKIEDLEKENQDLRDEIKTLEKELNVVDKWLRAYPR